jgi:hypothetical protein
VNLFNLAYEEGNDHVSPFSTVSISKEFSWQLPHILDSVQYLKHLSVCPGVGGGGGKIFGRHILHTPFFERLFRKKSMTQGLLDT